jgi:DNA-binding GntR family transcriptional regulator
MSAQGTRPRTTSQWLFDELRAAVIRGDYKAGQPIRQEEVAEKYNVSRMPVREVMRLLEAEGLVEQRPHRGAVVAELDADDALELFEMRATLEALGVRRSFPRLNNNHIKAIEEAHQALEKARRSETVVKHRDFHLSLYAAAGPRLQKVIGDQLDAAQRYHLRFGRPGMEVSADDRREHIALVEAARRRDVDAAVKIVEKHVGGGGSSIAQSIAERKQSGTERKRSSR